MADEELPQIYLITPPQIDLATYPATLARVLDSHEIACVRLALASQDSAHLGQAADALRELTLARDIALVIDSHVGFVEPHGLDGVHLNDGARSVRKVRKLLGADAIVGSHCGTSRHDGLNAAESGADYISFGPVGETALGDGTTAGHDLFEWWSEMIEVPVVAEGGIDAAVVAAFTPVTDFFAIGMEIWSQEDPAQALSTLVAAMKASA